MQLGMQNRGWIAALLAIAALVAFACSDLVTATPVPTATVTPAPTAAPSPTPAVTNPGVALTAEEADYIEQVRAGWTVFNSKAGGFREAFAQVYALRSRLFETLKDAGAGSAFEGALQAVEQIDPPQRFQREHQLMLEAMTRMVGYDHDVGKALDDQDLPGFAVANAKMGEAGGLMALQLSADLCSATDPPDRAFSFCGSGEALPGGEYGKSLNSAISRFNVGIVTRFPAFPAAFTPEDEIATLTVFLPEEIDVYVQTLDEVKGFQPPSDLSADHLRLIRYLEEQLENNREQDSALQVQDLGKYREVSGQARELYCALRRGISSDMMQIVQVHFGDPLGNCGAPRSAPPPDREPELGDSESG